jgi:hypothetical protein
MPSLPVKIKRRFFAGRSHTFTISVNACGPCTCAYVAARPTAKLPARVQVQKRTFPNLILLLGAKRDYGYLRQRLCRAGEDEQNEPSWRWDGQLPLM